MAGALAFRTLFGLLPVLVVGTVLIRAFRGYDQFAIWMADVFSRLGMDDIHVMGVAEVGQDGPSPEQSLSQWLLGFVSQVEALNFAAIGWVGMAVLVYAAIGLMVTIENSFNTIYRAPEGRGWARRLTIYWTVLTLGPTLLGLTAFLNIRFERWIETVSSWQWLLSVAPAVWGFIVIWLFMFAIYKLVPNTTVSMRAVMVGAFVTAILVELGRRALGAYLDNMLLLRHLYGPLGLIPLFMFWVYIMWLVVLFGLEVSAILQMLGGRRLEELDRKSKTTGLVDPAAVMVVMEHVARRFGAGRFSTSRQIAEASDLPEPAVTRMLDQLVASGYLHRLEHQENAVALAKPPDQIPADKLIEIGFQMVRSGPAVEASELLERFRAAQRTLAARLTLSSLTATEAGQDAATG
jgi:membrane protein